MLSIIQICSKVLDIPSGREILIDYCQCCKEQNPLLDTKRSVLMQYIEMNKPEDLDISELSQNLYFLSVANPQIVEMIERDVLAA
jgi:hypothetical protein